MPPYLYTQKNLILWIAFFNSTGVISLHYLAIHNSAYTGATSFARLLSQRFTALKNSLNS